MMALGLVLVAWLLAGLGVALLFGGALQVGRGER